jgi:hypothetical protein
VKTIASSVGGGGVGGVTGPPPPEPPLPLPHAALTSITNKENTISLKESCFNTFLLFMGIIKYYPNIIKIYRVCIFYTLFLYLTYIELNMH